MSMFTTLHLYHSTVHSSKTQASINSPKNIFVILVKMITEIITGYNKTHVVTVYVWLLNDDTNVGRTRTLVKSQEFRTEFGVGVADNAIDFGWKLSRYLVLISKFSTELRDQKVTISYKTLAKYIELAKNDVKKCVKNRKYLVPRPSLSLTQGLNNTKTEKYLM